MATTFAIGTEGSGARALFELTAYANRDQRDQRIKASPRPGTAVHYVIKICSAAALLSTAIHPMFAGEYQRRETHPTHYLKPEFMRLRGLPLMCSLEIIEAHCGIALIEAILRRLEVIRRKDGRVFFANCLLSELLQHSLEEWENEIVFSPDSTKRNAYPVIREYCALADELLVRALKQRKLEGSLLTPEVPFSMFGMGKSLAHLGGLYFPDATVQQNLALILSPRREQPDLLPLPNSLGKSKQSDHYSWLCDCWAVSSIVRFKFGATHPKVFAWLKQQFFEMSADEFVPFQLEMGLFANNQSSLEKIESLSRLFSRL